MKELIESMVHLTRCKLLRLGTLAAAGSLFTRFQPAMAGPFTGADISTSA